MLRKKAIVRAALVAHVTKQMQTNTLTIESCFKTPPEVLHLSLERMQAEPDDVLIQILNTISMARPFYLNIFSYYNNTVLKRFC
jgi:hypothetical protein